MEKKETNKELKEYLNTIKKNLVIDILNNTLCDNHPEVKQLQVTSAQKDLLGFDSDVWAEKVKNAKIPSDVIDEFASYYCELVVKALIEKELIKIEL